MRNLRLSNDRIPISGEKVTLLLSSRKIIDHESSVFVETPKLSPDLGRLVNYLCGAYTIGIQPYTT
ncbi:MULTISPECIES: hypothetical protein [unclassified Moorena]|uniref:hypothetical protein n=1 Tax=unclassified Moorena TaxID=2683338 RepID=UPI001054E760|nr:MULTISPECIES: hypothetical protein [unclassified Moorena]NEP31645.1 hypothetical protein [Moorena sp. SIO3B2]NER89170.1 hypothetical protein [Moorena sp. SIO3A2]NES42097.1 hypothetical protein [Moorena sp. SIO2C4]